MTKSHNFSLLADLYNGSKLIKYSSRISPQLREIIKDNSLNLKNNTNTNTQSITFSEGLFKERGVPSSVQLARAITWDRKILRHNYKNIPNKACIYTETDNVVLQKPLTEYKIGTK